MPTIIRADGFEIRILLPPREHGPAHVHVHKGGTSCVINLPDGDSPMGIRTIYQMKQADLLKAYRLVEAELEPLLRAWRKYHG